MEKFEHAFEGENVNYLKAYINNTAIHLSVQYVLLFTFSL